MSTKLDDQNIDSYLTNFIVKHKQGTYASDFIAPPFQVTYESGKYHQFSKENFRIFNNKVTRKEPAKCIDVRLDDPGIYLCEPYSLETTIDWDTKDKNMDPINLEREKSKQLKDSQSLSREKRIWDIAGSGSIITQTTGKSAAWATASSGTPVADILTAIGIIHTSTHEIANSIIMGLQTALKVIVTAEWKDYFKYSPTMTPNLFDLISGLRLIGLEPMIAGAWGLKTYEGTASDPTVEEFVSDSVLIFKREPKPTIESNCFMYSPFCDYNVIRKGSENRKRYDWYSIYEKMDELLVNANCAYLYTDVI